MEKCKVEVWTRTNKEQKETMADFRATIKPLQATIVNLNETLDEFKREFFGISSEKASRDFSINFLT